LLGVTVYVPFARPVKVKLPDEFEVVDPLPAPLSDTVALLPPLPLIVPEIE